MALLFDPQRAAAALDECGLDALIAATPPNVLYLTRYRGPARAVAVLCRNEPDRPFLILPASDIDFILIDRCDAVRVFVHGRFHRFFAAAVTLTEREQIIARLHAETRADADPWALVAEALKEGGAAHGSRGSRGTVGVDLPEDRTGVWQQRLPEHLVRAGSAVFHRLRAVKTPEELRRLEEAARITENAIDASARAAAPGVTQRQLARAFNLAVTAADADVRMDNVSIDRGAALVNLNTPGDVVREGSVIRYDVGVVQEGYGSDLARCFCFGRADDRVRRCYEALLAGQERALSLIRPGIAAEEVFHATVGAVREAGIPHYDRTHVGHGIGIAGEGYDAPVLAPGDRSVLEEGMVLCVETPYYEIGFAGLQVEDMIVVTPGGCRLLSHSDRSLRVLP